MASHLLAGGADVRHVQAMLGHANIMTTQLYTHVQPLEVIKEFERTHPRAKRRHRWDGPDGGGML